jgi:hypothetical protein
MTVLLGAMVLAACSPAPASHPRSPGRSATKPAAQTSASLERWVVISNSITNTQAPIIFQGVFTAGGTGINGQYTNKIVLPGGTFILDHRHVPATNHLDPRSCLDSLTGSGPYTLGDGTGRYKGIKGHGNLRLDVRYVLSRTNQGCDQHAKPLAYIEIDSGSGPVSLPK